MTKVRRRRRGSSNAQAPQSEPDSICCETCLWLDQGLGECHAGPPVPIPSDDSEIASEWPPVEDGTWCASWVHYSEHKGVLAYLAKHGSDVDFGGEIEADDDSEEEDDSD